MFFVLDSFWSILMFSRFSHVFCQFVKVFQRFWMPSKVFGGCLNVVEDVWRCL